MLAEKLHELGYSALLVRAQVLPPAANSTLDLEDDNPACDSNIWRNNSFMTANQTCIQ